jgi:AAA+ ATPase superfamily predicted ATPase
MKKIIGREQEINKLNEIKDKKDASLIAIYGRRRIGKTFLIRNYFKDEIIFEITGLYKGTPKDQLENFRNELDKNFNFLETKKINTWLAAFQVLENVIKSNESKKKRVIFIDEFPWIASKGSKFLMAFENFWNQFASQQKNLIIVICGSAASYMVKNIIKNKGGLHNRLTESIRLLPFTLKETASYLKANQVKYSLYDIAQLYLIIGGVPHYLNKIKPTESVAQNIDRLCFQQNGELAIEFNMLFASLFDNSEKHLLIVKTLATSLRGLTRNELLEKTGLPSGGDTSSKLEELIQSGFMEEYTFYKNKSHLKRYRLTDEYSQFYLKYISKNKQNGPGTWINIQKSQSFKSWSGFSFENLCLKHLQSIKKALGVASIYTQSSSWNNKNAQIDLIIERDDNIINLCEIKFLNNDYQLSKNDYSNIKNKLFEFEKDTKTRKTIFVTLITTFGLKPNEYSNELINKTITLKDLFK